MINWFDVGVSKKLKIFPLRKIESTQQQKKNVSCNSKQ